MDCGWDRNEDGGQGLSWEEIYLHSIRLLLQKEEPEVISEGKPLSKRGTCEMESKLAPRLRQWGFIKKKGMNKVKNHEKCNKTINIIKC